SATPAGRGPSVAAAAARQVAQALSRSACRSRYRVCVMELRQITYFLAVAAELNFRRAARRCNVAQPSVTNAIQALERELGGALFCRQRPIKLSELGAAVLPHLARIAHEVEHAREVARARVEALAAPAPDASTASG